MLVTIGVSSKLISRSQEILSNFVLIIATNIREKKTLFDLRGYDFLQFKNHDSQHMISYFPRKNK